MKEEELRRCEIRTWYPKFKPYTIKTFFHPLPDSFVRYILGETLQSPRHRAADDDAAADDDHHPIAPSFVLPRSTTGHDPFARTTADQFDPVSSLSLFDSDSDSDDDIDEGNSPIFPDLESAVQRSIVELGGAAFPKLNWSAPKDATWVSFDRTLKCTSFSEVALLLHSSDAATHDLCYALPSCSDHQSPSPSDFYLALRKWLPSLGACPEMEFRCFARRRRLIAISQREVTGFYPALLEVRDEIPRLIQGFFEEIVGPRFDSEDYTFDVYVTKKDRKVKLLDFNPWGVFTLPMLFTWEELEGEGFGDESVVFRIVESRCGVRPGLKTTVPYDYMDTGEGSGWDQFFKRVEKEQRRQTLCTEI